MNTNEQIEALAKLDGCIEPAKIIGSIVTSDGKNIKVWNCPHYLESYDAIIPTLKKLDGKTQRAVERGLMESGFMYYWDASPAQLSELILKALNLWK